MANDLHFAVVVGIGSYPGIKDLRSPLKDAQAFYDWLIGEGGVPAANVERVTVAGSFSDVLTAQPTRTEVNAALRKVNAAVQARVKARPLDREKTRLYLYASGHGISPEGSEAAVLMANAGPDAWGENIPCAAYLKRYLDCQYFREVVVFADCCRLRQAAEFPGPPFSANVGLNIGPVDGLLGFATQLGDAAYEPTDGTDPDEARSYFTQALLEGLKGSAADETTGEINSVTLARYATARVKILTQKKRYPQVPKMDVDLARPIVFRPAQPAAAPALKPKHRVTIAMPAGFAGDAVIEDRDFAVIERHTAGGAAWVVVLPDGLYGVRPARKASGDEFQNRGLFAVRGGDLHVPL